MSNAPAWRRYLRFIRPNAAADLDDELRDHIESTIEELVSRGASPESARAEAMRRFGNVARVRSEVERIDATHQRRTDRLAALESLWYDVRHGARGLRRSMAFTLVAVISIALGVAANATIFSVVNAVLLRPIPGTHADRLVRVYHNHHSPFEWSELAWLRDRATHFDAVVGERYLAMAFRAAPDANPERIHTSYVTRGFFPMFGVRAALGRTFDLDERSDAGATATVAISYAFWQRRFAGDSAILGRRIFLGDHPVTVVGVIDPQFRGSVIGWMPDVFVPLALVPVLTGQSLDDLGGSFYTSARLGAGVDRRVAEAELNGAMAQLVKTDTTRYGGDVRLDHVRGVNAEERAGAVAGSVFLMAVVGMVLLIACTNVANLLLGRAARRRTEIGVRLAIGASRARLVRQFLVESLLLSALGTAAGFGIAWFITRLLPAALPAEAGLGNDYLAPDGRVIAFTALLCLGTTVVFGLLPALRATSPNLAGMFKGDDAPQTGRRSRRGALVVVQASMCVLLLALASLFLRSLASSQTVDPGFRADGVVDVHIDLGLLGKSGDPRPAFQRILRQASAMPGVTSATLAAVVPLSGSNMETRVTPEGVVVRSRQDSPLVYFNVIMPKFFTTLRTPIVRGRELSESDISTSSRVAIVNETAVKRMFPSGDAIGKRFHWGGADGETYEVIGIARDANYVMPGESPKPTVYLPLGPAERMDMTLQLRTSADIASVRTAVWAILRQEAPTLPPPEVVRMVDDMSITLLPVRAGAVLLGAFGAIALVLAGAGIYGVASYSVATRTKEIGIRAALGATRMGIVRMVVWENGRRVAIGAAIGLAVTVGLAAALGHILYGVQAVDPIVLGSVLVVVAMVAMLATLGPAWRAARADPVSSIRES